MMVSPGLRMPARSASSIIRRLIRSFTLPPALKNSHLATADESQTEGRWVINARIGEKNSSNRCQETHIFHIWVQRLWGSCWCGPWECPRSCAGCLEGWGETWFWKEGSGGSRLLVLILVFYNCVLHFTRVHPKPESRVLLWNLEVWGIGRGGS